MESFSNNFSFKKIKENKYFSKFDNLKGICEELQQIIKKERTELIEKGEILILIISFPSNEMKNENIQFELKEDIKNEKEQIKDINKILLELKNEIDELKNIINGQNNEIIKIKKENIELRNMISDKNKEINQLKEEMECCVKNNTCCLFNNNLNYVTQIYNISKYPLPHDCKVELYFTKVDWVRVGVACDKELINSQEDDNSPLYDIYYILEDLRQFYSLAEGWKNLNKEEKGLKNGDRLCMILKGGIIKYLINDKEICGTSKVNLYGKKDIYLLVHRRNERTECEIRSIIEI